MSRHAVSFALLATLTTCAAPKAIEVLIEGETKTLRERGAGDRASAPETPPLLIIALDGVSRDLLYEMLRAGELPNVAALLGGDDLAHAYFDERTLSTLPSSTMTAWATLMTGLTPAEHGVSGNEYFVREREVFECPSAISFEDGAPTFEIYTDGYLNKLIDGGTIYERMKGLNRDSLIWVAMHGIYRGADKLLMARRTVVGKAFEAFLVTQVKALTEDRTSRKLFASLDEEVLEVVEEQLERTKDVVPDVLTIYLSGPDLYAHVAEEGPDKARRTYLKEIIDPAIAPLVKTLRARDTLANRWVVITADHGHTEVMEDTDHAIDTAGPKAVLERAGFVVRKFQRKVDEDDSYSAVFAYGGAMAYVYLADRSTCGDGDAAGTRCTWKRPPRYEQDVLPAAEAFWAANARGAAVAGMAEKLDMIFVRRAKPHLEVDLPFEVYVGGGKTMPVDDYLRAHPHPTYVEVESRLRDLAVGSHGERAGDLLLLANNGNKDKPEDRYYFAHPYKSWHGSPARSDSEIPLIVAHAGHSAKSIGAFVTRVLGPRAAQQRIANVLLEIRANPPKK